MTGGFLIVRRGGALWGLPAEDVSGIERVERPASAAASTEGATPRAGGFELRLASGGRLAVEAVLTLAADLMVRPLSARLRPFLPAGSAGLAMLAGEPIVLLLRDGEVGHV